MLASVAVAGLARSIDRRIRRPDDVAGAQPGRTVFTVDEQRIAAVCDRCAILARPDTGFADDNMRTEHRLIGTGAQQPFTCRLDGPPGDHADRLSLELAGGATRETRPQPFGLATAQRDQFQAHAKLARRQCAILAAIIEEMAGAFVHAERHHRTQRPRIDCRAAQIAVGWQHLAIGGHVVSSPAVIDAAHAARLRQSRALRRSCRRR